MTRWLCVALWVLTAPAWAATATSLTASWNAPTTLTDGSPLTTLSGYRLYVEQPCPGPSYATVPTPTPAPQLGDQISVEINGLTPSTTYTVWVTAVTPGGESACAGPASGTTLAAQTPTLPAVDPQLQFRQEQPTIMPTFDAISTVIDQSANPTTYSHTVAAGANALYVYVCQTSGQGPITVTFDGVAMTEIGIRDFFGGFVRMQMFRLVNPATGTKTVSISNSSGNTLDSYAASFSGVDTTTPEGTLVSADGSASPATVNVTSAAGELVLDAVFIKAGGSALAAGAGQTERWNEAFHGNVGDGASTEAGDTTVTMSWTWSGATDAWGIMAVPIKPAAAAGAGRPIGLAIGRGIWR